MIAMNAVSAFTNPALTTSSSLVGGKMGTPAADGTASSTPFSGLMNDTIGQVDSLQNQARVAVDGLMTGSGVDVHQAMIATQKAEMSFELALALRNKAVQAYQSVMGMQF